MSSHALPPLVVCPNCKGHLLPGLPCFHDLRVEYTGYEYIEVVELELEGLPA